MRRNLRGFKNFPEKSVYGEMDSPVGRLTIVASPDRLYSILWESDLKDKQRLKTIRSLKKNSSNKVIRITKEQLKEYFQGKRKKFDLPLSFNGTPFQNQCWKELTKIPYSKTMTYGEQAQKLGNKNKARAVGMANGLNPISIVVPCHRVIGSSGDLIGFAGGLETKKFLLKLEGFISD